MLIIVMWWIAIVEDKSFNNKTWLIWNNHAIDLWYNKYYVCQERDFDEMIFVIIISNNNNTVRGYLLIYLIYFLI